MYFRHYIKFIFIIAFVCIANKSYTQVLLGEDISYIQEARVGLVDEFIKRFNGDISHPDISQEETSLRKNNILFLILPPQNVANLDSMYNEAVKFAEAVITSSVRINFSDSIWFARAKCKGVLEGKSVSFDIYLNVEHRKDDMYKWVISKADGILFDITPKDSVKNIMLYPDDHETKFISLGRMTKEQPYNVARFVSKGTRYDPTSVFQYLVNSNKLKISHVEDLEFIFTQIPGYVFTIKYFERESNKLGWLINKFDIKSPAEKVALLQSLNIEYDEKSIMKDSVNSIEKPNLQNVSAIPHVKNLKETFLSRIIERKTLIRDYILLLHSVDKKEDVEYYKKKLYSLFTPDSYVYIYNASKEKTTKIPVGSFIKRIAADKYKTVEIDKITIPLWDEVQMFVDVDRKEVLLKAVVEMFNNSKSQWTEDTDQLVVSKMGPTDNGVEWLPYFGNIFVIVK